jgi:hypothetical protein
MVRRLPHTQLHTGTQVPRPKAPPMPMYKCPNRPDAHPFLPQMTMEQPRSTHACTQSRTACPSDATPNYHQSEAKAMSHADTQLSIGLRRARQPTPRPIPLTMPNASFKRTAHQPQFRAMRLHLLRDVRSNHTALRCVPTKRRTHERAAAHLTQYHISKHSAACHQVRAAALSAPGHPGPYMPPTICAPCAKHPA